MPVRAFRGCLAFIRTNKTAAQILSERLPLTAQSSTQARLLCVASRNANDLCDASAAGEGWQSAAKRRRLASSGAVLASLFGVATGLGIALQDQRVHCEEAQSPSSDNNVSSIRPAKWPF